MRTIDNWIDGGRVAGPGEEIPVLDPSRDRPVATVAVADRATVEAAIASADRAGAAWGALSLSRRAQVLFDFRGLLLEHRDELAELMTAEHGKTLDDAVGEVMRSIDSVELATGGPALQQGATSLSTGPRISTRSMLHPVGVCVGITPFNFPSMVGLAMISVSLAAGNSFIWKPSEQAPGAAVLIAELFKRAGLPDGVLNVVHGRQEVAEQLIDDPRTKAVSFVGSSGAAHAVYRRAADAGKRVQAFGGAKNHLLVMPDADVEVVADQLSSAAFGSAGQRCMAISVAVVVGHDPEPLLTQLAVRARDARVAGGDTPGAEIGPVVSRPAQERIRDIVARTIDAGARAVVDRSREMVEDRPDGYFVGPTILADVPLDSPCYLEEVFGPVLVVLAVDTLDEALALINEHRYGNGASIFTQDGAAADHFEREVGAGMVGVNVAIPVPVAGYAVQGWKDSVFGDTGLNNASWSFYTRPKYVTGRWQSATGQDFGFRPN